MKLIKTKFEETYIIKNQKIKDERGFFMRGFCESVFLEILIFVSANGSWCSESMKNVRFDKHMLFKTIVFFKRK